MLTEIFFQKRKDEGLLGWDKEYKRTAWDLVVHVLALVVRREYIPMS